MDNVNVLIKMLKFKSQMTPVEQEALLSELMGCYVTKTSSTCMTCLLLEDFKGFQDRVEFMNSQGLAIKNSLKGE